MRDRVRDNENQPYRSNASDASHAAEHPSNMLHQDQNSRLHRIIGNQGVQRMPQAGLDRPPSGVGVSAQLESGHRLDPTLVRAETLPDDLAPSTTDADVAKAQDAGAPAPAPAPAPPAPAPARSASLSVTGDGSYDDKATYSHKNVTFNVTWSGGSKEDYIVVNWLKGYIKKPDGTPFKVSMYGKLVDFDFSAFQVDSVDEDPAYWSNGGVRWRYNVDAADKFSATDSPGPPTFAKGTKAMVDFKTAAYKSSDVPSTTSGTIAATPLSSFQPWTYHMEVTDPGKYSH